MIVKIILALMVIGFIGGLLGRFFDWFQDIFASFLNYFIPGIALGLLVWVIGGIFWSYWGVYTFLIPLGAMTIFEISRSLYRKFR